jgi:hypothetical protein
MDRDGRTQIASTRVAATLPVRVAALAVAGGILAAALGGCVYSKETERVATPPPPVVVAPPAERVVVMPPGERVVVAPGERVLTSVDGRWQLHGDGTSAAPYYWAWIPAGTNPPPPPPPPRVSGSIR